MRLTHRLAIIASLTCALGTWAATAEAASVAPRGKVRVSVDTELLSWTQSRPFYNPSQQPAPYPMRYNVIGLGPGRPVAIDGHPLAGGNTLVGFGVGYGIHKHLLLGARFGVNFGHSYDRNNNPGNAGNDDSTAMFVGSFTPYLEILPIAEGRVLPFILVRSGFTGTTATPRDGADWHRASTMTPQVGVGVGAHAFVTRYFSIDFGLTFDYRWTHGRVRNRPGIDVRGWPRATQSFTLAATLGLSTWF